jgi:hypothetical protein
MKFLHLLFVACVVFVSSCEKKAEPRPAPVIVGRDGDTCRISKVSYGAGRQLLYEYTGSRVSRIIARIEGFDYPSDLHYDLNGRLERVSGSHVDAKYEYDSKGRLVKENRILHNEGTFTLIPHYEARIFEYNEKDEMIKCSYVEGRGTDYNSFYVKKGEVYLYETYLYDIQGSVYVMETYERTPSSASFKRTSQNVYTYDKMINPFYGHPGIYDFGMYFGAEIGNGVICFSQHNIVKETAYPNTEITAYVYSPTKYPLSGQNVQWQQGSAKEMIFEYTNCK